MTRSRAFNGYVGAAAIALAGSSILAQASQPIRKVAPQVSLPITFSLKAEAMVKADRVYAADIVECKGSGEICEEAYAVDVGVAPHPGKSRVINRIAVARIFAKEWPDHKIEMAGATHVRIMAEGHSIDRERLLRDLRATVADRMQQRKGLAEDFRVVVLDAKLSSQVVMRDREFSLSFPLVDRAATESYDWLMAKFSGQQSFEAVAKGVDDSERRFFVTAQFAIEKQLVVARVNLERRQIIRKKHLAREWVRVTPRDGAVASAEKQVIGKRTRQRIRVGETFRLANLSVPPIIRRGEIAKLEMKKGGLQVSAKVKILKSGGYGESVPAVYLDTGKNLSVQIVRPGVVSMRL